jgi:tRNA(Ile2) C34 agmatinyltransferase TiaS
MIRHKKGFERIRILLTGLRGYLCRDCDTSFRGPDRRTVPREGKMGVSIVPKQI